MPNRQGSPLAAAAPTTAAAAQSVDAPDVSKYIVSRVVPVTGPPGAGKSSALIALQRGSADFARMGVRDYGLDLAARNDPLGLAMRDTLQHQELLSDELVRAEFLHLLDNVPNTVRVVAVEGYPRDTPSVPIWPPTEFETLYELGDLTSLVA